MALYREFTKTIVIPRDAEYVRERAITYWQGRGFVFSKADGMVLVARRGNVWGNLTSWESVGLVTRLTIDHSALSSVHCYMRVCTVFQFVTEWDTAYWTLEMDTFERLLQCGDEKNSVWDVFLPAYRQSIAQRKRTLGTFGNTVPDALKVKLDERMSLLRPASRSEDHPNSLLRPLDGSSHESATLLRAPDVFESEINEE